MATFRSQENALINEGYDIILLKESTPLLTLSQLQNNMDLLSESEAEYICTVCERFISEAGIFSGLKNLGGAVGGALGGAAKNVAGNLAGKAQQFGSNVKQQVGQAASNVGQAASNVAQAGKAAYRTGATEGEFAKFLPKAQQYIDQLLAMLKQAQDKGLINFGGDVSKIPLKTVADKLLAAKSGAGEQASAAKGQFTKGLFGKAQAPEQSKAQMNAASRTSE